jgi:hypothetical protein
MRKLPIPLFLTFLFFCFCLSLRAIDSKGAIIIASMEGQVTVTNNESGLDLASDQIKVGGLLFDGHTVKTGTGSKIVLLFSSGTITTLKEGSVLNIKKFAQKSFDPKTAGKLSARKDEPSPSETVIDLSLGDMVVDVKKLKKESSFNIDSPVGTAGIRGTIPRMKVVKLPDGGFNQTTQMLKGKISYMPKGGGRPMLLGPGQSLASGITAAGMVLPFQIGKVPVAVMDAIQAEVDKSSAATGKAADGPPPADTPDSNPEDDAPSDDELNESDEDRQAAGKGVGDDDNGSEALALEKAGILDLENPEDAAKADTYVEVAGTAAEMLDQKVKERRSGRRSSDSKKDDGTFVSDLVSNFGNVVDVTKESEELGLKDPSKISSFAESAEQSGDLLAVLGDAEEIGAKNSENMDAVFSNPDKATNLKKVIGAAKDAFSSDRRSGDGEISQDGKDTMSAMFRTAAKADEVAAVVDSAQATQSTNSDQGDKKVLGVFKVVKSVDQADQDKKAAEAAALKAAEEATAKKAAEEAAAQRAADELAAAQAAGNAEAIAAAQAASEAAAKKKAAVDDYSAKLESIKSASDSVSVDALLAEFNGAHDAEVVSLLASDGFDLSANADARRSAIKAEASFAQKETVFGNLDDVSELAVASIEVEQQAALEAAAASAKKAAADDYQANLSKIELAESATAIDEILADFTNAHAAEYREGLDLITLANAQKDILSSDESERAVKQAAAAAAKADAEARALAKAAAAEKAKADAEAKASDTGFDSMIENADQAKNLRKIVEKNAEIEAAAKAQKDAAEDYQLKLTGIANAQSVEAVDALVLLFISNNLEKYRKDLDISTVAESRKSVLSATDDAARVAAEEAAIIAAAAAADAAASATAAADAVAANKADVGSLLKNADKANDLADVLDAAETLDTTGDTSTLTALLKNPEGASDLKKGVEKSAGIKAAALDYENKLEAIKIASTAEAVDDLISLFTTNHLAEYRTGLDLSALAESRKTVLSATDDAALATAENAAAAAAASAEAAAASADSNDEYLKVMFTVVQSSDAKQVAAKKKADDAAASGAFIPFSIEELISGSEDKSILQGWKSTGVVDGEDFNSNTASLGLLQTLIDNRIEEINSKNVLAKIDTVVEVAKTTLDQVGDAGLDSILDNADKADELKILVDQAVDSGGTDGAADLLNNVLDNAEKATELSEVVVSAAEEGIDVTKLLENAEEADSLLKAKQAADEVASQAEEQKRAEIAASGQNLSDEEIAAQVAAAKSSAKKEVMESVAANAENAESVATVLDAAAGADAETKAALLRNAEEAVAMAQTINEEIAIKAAAVEAAAADAAAVEAAAALLEEQKSGASADELAAIQAEIDAVRLAAEQKKAAEAKFSTDLLSATSLGQVEVALNEYKLILAEGEAVPESISSLAASRKKNLSLINVVKQVDGNKQEAKAIAAQAENALVSTTFRDAAQSKTSISELEQLLIENLPSDITDTALKSKIFKAKTEAKIRELLSAFDTLVVDVAVDHWMVVFPKKEELNAVLAFQSIDSLADVASKTAVVAEDIIVDDALSQDAKDAISDARDALEIAESIEGIDEILTGLTDLSIEIPSGLSSYADSLKKSINTLNAVLENAEQADQVAVMIGSDDGGVDESFLDSFSSGGDDFDFDAVMATGALGSLKGSEFVEMGLNFNEFYAVDVSTQISLSSDISSFSKVGADFLSSPESITDSAGNTVYKLSATQVDNLTGESGGIDGVYSFIETLDPDTDEVIGVVISPSSKKIGVDGVDSFAVDSDRASDVLLILESEALKTLDSDSDEEKVKKAELRDDFIANADQLDNLLKLNRAIGEDQEKVETALENLSSLDDLAAVSDRLRFDTEKLNQVFSILDDPEIDDLTKSENLMYFRSLSDKFHTSPSKLDAVFSNTDKLEVLDDLTDRLDKNLDGYTEDKGQVNLLFANLDYADEYLDIVNRFEGTKRDSVLKDINSLVTTNPKRKDIIFSNPTQVSSLNKLYQEFKFEPNRVEIIFEHAEKADAFLDVLNDLRGPDGVGNYDVLFTSPISTMENQGLAKLKAEYPERYWSIFDENLDRAAEISSVASKFKENEEFLELVFTNIDKLDDINEFTNEFGFIELVDVVVDESRGEVEQQEVFKYDDILMGIFFANIDNLAEINNFKRVVESVGIPGGDALKIFDNEPGWLSFVLDGETSIEFDADDRLILSTDQLKAGQFLADLYGSGVPVTEIPLALAEELFTLGLSRNELKMVLEDLLDGPIMDPPGSNPPSNDENDPTANADLKTLNFLLDHSFSGNISSDLLVSADIAMASSFFKESMNVFEELSMLGESLDQFVPDSEDQIRDSGSDGSISFSDEVIDVRRVRELDNISITTDSNYEESSSRSETVEDSRDDLSTNRDESTDDVVRTDSNYEESSSRSETVEDSRDDLSTNRDESTDDVVRTDSNYQKMNERTGLDEGSHDDEFHHDDFSLPDADGVLGGRNLSFGAGNYDLSLLSFDRFLFAASDMLTLSGDVSFTVGQDNEIYNQLILMSAGGLKIEKGSNVRFEGESLGIGSFNSLRVIEVDLFAQDEISLRSLDRLVLENSKMVTSGRGEHDAVELLAYQEISVDNLRFNENIKRIAMEAMTINLSNLNFPAGSEVKLNSAHGGLDGKYPNFNSILYGRVNFIKNIRYATNPIMDRPSFDKYGGSVSIGKIGN